MQFVQPIQFTDATDLIGDKTAIGAALGSSEWSDVPVELRLRAMFSANVENVRFLQRAQDALGDFLSAKKVTLPDGQVALATGGRAAFIQQLREFAKAEGMGPLDPKDKGGLKDITSERRLGLIFDTQTRQAGDYGYWKQGMDPDVLNEFPAQRFIRVLDVKEPRLTHTPYQDQVYLKTDPIWAQVINQDFHVPWGPWGWGCGHDVEDVDRTEAEKLRLLSPGERLQPVKMNFNKNLQASTRGLAPELLAKLKKVFGEQIQIKGDTMAWTGLPVQSPKSKVQGPQPTSTMPAGTPALPGTKTAGGTPAARSPVSAALEVKVRGGLRTAVDTALDAIDQVHDDGELPTIPIHSKPSRGALGQFFSSEDAAGNRTADGIGVLSRGRWPALTAIHEVGHFLDLEAIGSVAGKFATRSGDPGMAAVLAAAEQTSAIRMIRKTAAQAAIGSSEEYMANYFLRPSEIWARAYAQFIAEESGDATLALELAKTLDQGTFRQWTTEDFKPISGAIKTLFKQLGWL